MPNHILHVVAALLHRNSQNLFIRLHVVIHHSLYLMLVNQALIQADFRIIEEQKLVGVPSRIVEFLKLDCAALNIQGSPLEVVNILLGFSFEGQDG